MQFFKIRDLPTARLLVKQIEAYPLSNRAVDELHAHFPCHIVKQVQTRRFTKALISGVNATDVGAITGMLSEFFRG